MTFVYLHAIIQDFDDYYKNISNCVNLSNYEPITPFYEDIAVVSNNMRKTRDAPPQLQKIL